MISRLWRKLVAATSVSSNSASRVSVKSASLIPSEFSLRRQHVRISTFGSIVAFAFSFLSVVIGPQAAAHAETLVPNKIITNPVAHGLISPYSQFIETRHPRCASFHQKWRLDWTIIAGPEGVYAYRVRLEVVNYSGEGFQIGEKMLQGSNGTVWQNPFWGSYVDAVNGQTWSQTYSIAASANWDSNGEIRFLLYFEQPLGDPSGEYCENYGDTYYPLIFVLHNAGPAAGYEPPTGNLADISRDGKLDILARNSSGELWLYPGNGSTGFYEQYRVGTGFGAMNSISVGDFNGDGLPDLLCRVASDGELRIYPHTGNASEPYSGTGVVAGGGWSVMTSVNSADVNLDGRSDIVARDWGGDLWLYPGNGNNTFRGRIQIGQGFHSLTAINVADFTKDDRPDIIARNSAGELVMYVHSGDTSKPYSGNGTRIGDAGFQGMSALLTGDFNRDGKPDLITRVTSNGDLRLYRHTGDPAAPLSTSVNIGTKWGPFNDLD